MNRQRRQISAFLAILCMGLFFSAEPQAQTKTQSLDLVFGLISPRSVAETRASWDPFIKRMGAAIGRSITLQVYESQSELVKTFVAGQIDVAWMGNVPALNVVEAQAGDIFAQMVTQDGNVGYKSLLIVRKNAPIQTLRDVLEQAKGLRFSDGDPKSTSGHLVPLYFAFQKNGVNNAQTIFKSIETGSHQQNLTKIAKEQTDVATANNEELAFFQRDFPDLAANIKVVWESPLIPQSPLLWKTNLSPDLRKKIKHFVVGFGSTNAEEKTILLALNGLSRFRPSNNRQLIPIADLEMFKTRQAITNEKALSSDERSKQIHDAIVRGSRLEQRLKRVVE
jgi:phosphonate transport system substrate-binding protein